MARPEKNVVKYFPLDCESGKKMFYIEETYGNDGFATFIKILQELARSEYHYLNLSKPTTIMFLSSKCKVSKDVLIAIINDLVDLEKFDKELWEENQIIWCEDFIISIQDAYLKRKNNCITRNDLLLLLDGLGVRKLSKLSNKQGLGTKNDTNNTQIRLDKIKEDKIKTDNTKFDFKKSLLNLVENEVLVNDYILLRKSKKASLSQTFFGSLKSECENNNYEVSEALKVCIERNWVGFKYSWIENLQKQDKKQSNETDKSTPVIGRQTAETIEHNLQGWDKPTYD